MNMGVLIVSLSSLALMLTAIAATTTTTEAAKLAKPIYCKNGTTVYPPASEAITLDCRPLFRASAWPRCRRLGQPAWRSPLASSARALRSLAGSAPGRPRRLQI
jgi:hypothetical protein